LTAYIIRRIAFLVPVCLGILVITFLLQVFIPSDVVSTMYQGQGTAQQTE